MENTTANHFRYRGCVSISRQSCYTSITLPLISYNAHVRIVREARGGAQAVYIKELEADRQFNLYRL